MTDTERIDWLQAELLRAAERGESAEVILSAWYSGPYNTPDGYAVGSGGEKGLEEFPTLRAAIDAAAGEEPEE